MYKQLCLHWLTAKYNYVLYLNLYLILLQRTGLGKNVVEKRLNRLNHQLSSKCQFKHKTSCATSRRGCSGFGKSKGKGVL